MVDISSIHRLVEFSQWIPEGVVDVECVDSRSSRLLADVGDEVIDESWCPTTHWVPRLIRAGDEQARARGWVTTWDGDALLAVVYAVAGRWAVDVCDEVGGVSIHIGAVWHHRDGAILRWFRDAVVVCIVLRLDPIVECQTVRRCRNVSDDDSEFLVRLRRNPSVIL